MYEYIERDAVIEKVMEKCISCNCPHCTATDVITILQLQPAADVVEVVRCKDCKHYALSGDNTFGIHICKKRGGVVGENDYCSRAEREEEA